MPDQADKLRQLVRDALPPTDAPASLPPTIVVAGAKGGVGTTTVALNLAVALSHGGRRTLLVDAAPNADAAELADMDTSCGPCLADVLAGDAAAADALRPGPAGVLLLANRADADEHASRAARTMDRLLFHLSSLATSADVLVIDSGSGMNAATRRLWQHADLVLLVTTPDDVAVMDAYATIKIALAHEALSALRVVTNQCDSARLATDVQQRLATACRRFLAYELPSAPRLVRDAGGSLAGLHAVRAWERPNSTFARSVRQLARFAADLLTRRQPHATPHSRQRSWELSPC